MLASRFVIRVVVERASSGAGATAAMALCKGVTDVDDASLAGRFVGRDLAAWHAKVKEAVGRHHAAVLGRGVPACQVCARRPARAHRSRLIDGLGLCGVLRGVLCRAEERLRRLIASGTGREPPLIQVEIAEGTAEDDPPFGLPFSAWTEREQTRARIHFAFSRAWLDERVGARVVLPDARARAGLEWAAYHEMQHALDHALDRPSSFAGSADHVFSEGWMDFAVSLLCSEGFNRYQKEAGALRAGLASIRQSREVATDAPPASRAALAERRQRGTAAAETFLDLAQDGLIPGGEAAFWSFTMALYAAPRVIAHRRLGLFDHHWRARVVEGIQPALVDLAADQVDSPAARALLQVVADLNRSRRLRPDLAVEKLGALIRPVRGRLQPLPSLWGKA